MSAHGEEFGDAAGAASSGTAPEDQKVGVGPLYETMRAEARSLVHLFAPAGVEHSQPWWGAGLCDVRREPDGTNSVFVSTMGRSTRALSVNWTASIEEIRGAAISLLVYCEAYGEQPGNTMDGSRPSPDLEFYSNRTPGLEGSR